MSNEYYFVSFLCKHNFFIDEKRTLKVFHEIISCFMNCPWNCISWMLWKFHSVSLPLQNTSGGCFYSGNELATQNIWMRIASIKIHDYAKMFQISWHYLFSVIKCPYVRNSCLSEMTSSMVSGVPDMSDWAIAVCICCLNSFDKFPEAVVQEYF